MDRRQGQYAIVEHTILIGLGLAIALGFLAAFQSMSGNVSNGASQAEARLLSKFMATSAIELSESGSSGKFTIDMPKSITHKDYAIRMTDNGVEVVSTGIKETASLYGLQRKLDADGYIISRTPVMSIVYADNKLSLGGEQ